jgi:HK97 family phage major capsid protein
MSWSLVFGDNPASPISFLVALLNASGSSSPPSPRWHTASVSCQISPNRRRRSSGTGVDMVGLTETPDILTFSLNDGVDTQLDGIARAINELRVGASYIEPDVIVMNPSDALSIRLSKDENLRYIASDPLNSQSPNIWGIPLVTTTQMTEGVVMVANLKSAAKVYVRQTPTIETSRGGREEFYANVSLIRAEERLALAVVRPTAICTITDFRGAS